MTRYAGYRVKNIEFQIAYSKAAATAFKTTLASAVGMGGKPAFNITTPFTTGLTLSHPTIRDVAFSYFKGYCPKAMHYTKDLFDGVAAAIAAECSKVTVTSINTFGGSVASVIFSGGSMGSLIFQLLPQKYKRGRFIKVFCESIAVGVQQAMASAKSQEIPNQPQGSPPPMGILTAKLS